MNMKNESSVAQQHEPLFQRLVEGVSDYAIFMLTPEGHVASWNSGAQRSKGYLAEEIIGQHFSRFYTVEDQAAGMPSKALQTALTEGKFEAEGWRVRKHGSTFWAHVVIDAVHNDLGELVGFAKITRDITERREAARALERARMSALQTKTEEHDDLLRLFEQAPGFVVFFRGPEHVYELQNAAHAQLTNHRDIIGKPVRKALPELEDQQFFNLLDKVFATGVAFVGRALPLRVERVSEAPAEQRYIDLVYQPIFGPDNKVIGIFSQGSDVTDRVLAEDEVKRNQQELERLVAERTEALEQARASLERAHQLQGDKTHLLRLFEQAPGFICFMKEPDHRFELANKAYYQLVGHRDLIGRTVREALPEVEGQGFFELLDRVFTSGEPFVGYSAPVNVQEQPGSPMKTRYIDFVYQPIIGTDGKVLGVFCQGNDVTEQKLAQDEVKRYQNELETLVTERTQALEQTRTALQRAQKLESIGKLTGGVAHDFNNILQVIGGNLQLLSAHLGNNELAAKRLETALGAVERGGKLSSQLLAFARRQPLQPAVVNAGRIIRGMEDLLQRALGETIRIETIVGAGVWNALVDQHQLENVVLNLAINARDAMPAGGKLTIEIGNSMLDDDYVSSQSDVPPGQYVMLAVSDTGAGMTAEVLEQACEPFFTTKPEGEGTGLGLSMAYGFVKQSAGHFKIYSEVGHGTTVKMYFPRSFDAETETLSYANRPVVGGTETILVVEDDIAVQTTVVGMLTSLGYRVLKADDAESGLSILKSGVVIDLLFTDVVMPGKLRSPELARQAKLLIPSIEVLFTSGYTQNAIVHGGRLDPGVELLSKPYRREQLARKIRHLFANRQQADLNRQAITSLEETAVSLETQSLRILVVEDNLDSQQMTCDILAVFGHKAQGVSAAEEAIEFLARDQFDVLFTDFSLPGMNGVELAKLAKQSDPGLKIIFASGYGDALEGTQGLQAVVLKKPYDMTQLQKVLEKT
ncbi:MAG: domain S-box protein [Herminiimonas sp.]|nr:domain S-box protein [Herminiimonas sp.]